ncbi:MAG: D-alanyl-D-alanine carboxypeptidase [Succinivibrionaceae bacterium]|nr:D-alanyl-D-alanine carboxypeptidase [Succinivibrionaceae bacterium]
MEVMPEPPALGEQAYILMDYDTGAVLLGKNISERIVPASLTKMMTSYVIGQEIQAGRLDKNQMVTISQKAWSKNYGDSSKMFIEVGKQVSVNDLNLGIIIQSGNDACIAMAEHIAGSEDAFATLMNEWAKYLGMNDSHFVNSHGLYDENHYSTAYDMALLGRQLIHDLPEEYKIYSQKEFTFNGIKQINRNRLLWDNTFHFDGIKTGHLSQVGYNLVASAVDDETDFRLISVVIGAKSESQRAEDSKKLLTYGFRFYKKVPITQAGKELITQRIYYGQTNEVKLGSAQEIKVAVPRNKIDTVKTSVKFDDKVKMEAPMKKGTRVGSIIVRSEDKIIYKAPLVALDQVDECGILGKIWDWIVQFFAGLFK